MSVIAKLSKYLGRDLCEVAEELGYSESNILIIKGEEATLGTKHPDVMDNIKSCRHNRDRRTPFEYAQDLVASWIFEDYLVDMLQKAGLTIGLAGADRKREILANNKVSAASDTQISFNGTTKVMEIMTDYGGFWKKSHALHLRDSKYTKLCNSKSLFIGFSTEDKKYVFFDFSKEVAARYIPNHAPWGFKPAYELKLNDGDLKDFSIEKLIEDIKACF